MRNKSILIILLIVMVAAGLGALSFYGIGENKLLGVNHIKQGLDLKGGVSITYEAGKENPTAEEMASAVSLIQGRLDRRGFSEAECAQQGTNRIRVDIPGVEDAETAISEIGQTAMVLFADEEGNVLLDGTYIVNAYKSVQSGKSAAEQDQIVVVLEFNNEGRQYFEQATAGNIGKRIYILLDEAIISAPTVQEKISGGNAVITGNSNPAEAEELAALIRAGSLPFELKVIDMSNVGAKLGADALYSGITAGALGILLVLLFMVFVYRLSGVAADIALLIYVGLDLIILSLFNVTLTLPGIAGIVLSIGMAVDANVIIFERIKEELNAGKSMRVALKAGFDRAFPAILDGNVTTLIAAAVLFWLGTGPIKGFAQTLSIGIVLSMFTCLVVTRWILHAFVGVGATNPKYLGAK